MKTLGKTTVVTYQNVLSKFSNSDLLAMPAKLKDGYAFVKETHDLYNDDEDIKKYISLWISKANTWVVSRAQSESKSIKKASAKAVKKTTTRKSKAKKTSRSATTKKADDHARLVSEIALEVRIIKRYVNMDGKKKTRDQVRNLLNTIQRAISKRQITKSSKYAKEIMHIQKELVNILDDQQVGNTFTFSLDESDKSVLDKFHKIAKSQKQRTSVRLISRYIGIHGRTAVKEKAERLLKAIKAALLKKQVTTSDPYRKEFMAVKGNLEDFLKAKDSRLEIDAITLKGLQGIPGLGACVTARKKKDSPVKCSAANTKISSSLKGVNGNSVMSTTELAGIEHKTVGFTGKWLSLIGDPVAPYSMMFWSRPGMGKSSLAIEYVHYIASTFGKKVLYVATEEGFGYTIKEKFIRLNAVHNNIHIAGEIPNDISAYNVIVIDSVTRMKMTVEDFVALKKRYPGKCFLLIFQATVDGNYRGSKEFEHEVDVSVNINENGYAKAMKSRFGGYGTIKVFEGKADSVYRFTNLQDAERFVANRKDEKLRLVQGDDGKVWATNPDKARELKQQGYTLF